MTKSLSHIYTACLFFVPLLLAGCAASPSDSAAPPAAPAAASAPLPLKTVTQESVPEVASAPLKQSALSEGIDLYNKGDYNGAVKRLAGAAEIWSGDKATQVAALKYMAFSYCVSARPTLCKQQFRKALKLDPGFDLAQGEKGHPLWGPVFERVKKQK